MDALEDIKKIESIAEDEFQKNANYSVYLKGIFKLIALYIKFRLLPYEPTSSTRRNASAR